MNNRIRAYIIEAILHIFLFAILIFALFPIIYAISGSLKSNMEIMTSGSTIFPANPTFDNYKRAWVLGNFKQYTWNSIYYSLIILASTLATSTMGGYVFARGDIPGKKMMFAAFTGLMFINLGSLTMYPLLGIAKAMHLNKSLWGLIVIKMLGISVANMYLVRGYVNSIPKEIDEAAKIDGCSFFGIFLNIISPLLKPIMATVGLLAFQGSWNEYLMPMVFTMANPSQMTLTAGIVALKNTGEAATSWNLMLAGSVISLMPILILYSFANRYFVSGIAAGAVKG